MLRGVTSGHYWFPRVCQFCHCLLLSCAQWDKSLVLLILPTNFGWRAESTLEGFKPVIYRSPCEDATDCANPAPHSVLGPPYCRLLQSAGAAEHFRGRSPSLDPLTLVHQAVCIDLVGKWSCGHLLVITK